MISRGLCLFLSEMLGTAPERPMGKSVHAPDSLGHKHRREFVITGPQFERSGSGLHAGCEGMCQPGVKRPSHRGQVQTALRAEGEALHDRTGFQVTGFTGNDSLTRWHICNYHL